MWSRCINHQEIDYQEVANCKGFFTHKPWLWKRLNSRASSSLAVTPEAPPRRRSLPYRLHEDYAPNWDFTTGGARMILTCSANDDDFEVPVDAQLHVSFDFKEVSYCRHRKQFSNSFELL